MMIGSVAAAALVAQVVFLALLVVAALSERMSLVAVFAALWLCGVAATRLVPQAGALFGPYVALLDILFVLIVFRGDVPLS
jgi:hypothetical protein